MAWLIGIIAIVIVVLYWRIFLPIIAVAAVGIGGWLLYEYDKDQREEAEREKNKIMVAKQIAEAKANASDMDRKWEVFTIDDPASGEPVPRLARIQSNDGLCYLTLEKRINGSELAGLSCSLFKISKYKDVQVKFDNYSTSDKMDLDGYNDSDGVYIPKYQSTYSGYLQYEEFIRRMSSGKAVSIQMRTSNAGTHWITFSLNGSTEAISAIYAGN